MRTYNSFNEIAAEMIQQSEAFCSLGGDAGNYGLMPFETAFCDIGRTLAQTAFDILSQPGAYAEGNVAEQKQNDVLLDKAAELKG